MVDINNGDSDDNDSDGNDDDGVFCAQSMEHFVSEIEPGLSRQNPYCRSKLIILPALK